MMVVSFSYCTNNGTTFIYADIDNDVDIDSNVFINVELGALQASCPNGMTLYKTNQGHEVCLLDNFQFPEINQPVYSICDQVQEGILGFYTELTHQSSNLQCPDGMDKEINHHQVSCLLDHLDQSFDRSYKEMIAFCSYLEDGFFGYVWDEKEDLESKDDQTFSEIEPEDIFSPCPENFVYHSLLQKRLCLIEDINLPHAESLNPECNQLQKGELGFSWSLTEDQDYQCPKEFEYQQDGYIGKCMIDEVDFELDYKITPFCDSLDKGYLGFGWEE
jgi:hypothetical protein